MAAKIGGSISNSRKAVLKFLIDVCLAVPTTFNVSRKGAPLTPFGRGKVAPYLYNLEKN